MRRVARQHTSSTRALPEQLRLPWSRSSILSDLNHGHISIKVESRTSMIEKTLSTQHKWKQTTGRMRNCEQNKSFPRSCSSINLADPCSDLLLEPTSSLFVATLLQPTSQWPRQSRHGPSLMRVILTPSTSRLFQHHSARRPRSFMSGSKQQH